MRYHLIPRTGLRVSELCLGAMTFGTAWGPMGADRETSVAMLRRFADAGGNFIDTANNYQGGESERVVGEFVKSERDRYVVASKYTLNTSKNDPNAWGNHRKNLRRAVEASLTRLGTDHLDLLYVHIWDFTTAPEEVMRGLEDLTRAGKVLHVGASDTPAWIVSRANAIADRYGWNPFSFVQVEYSLLTREVEHEIVPMANALGLAVAAWGALGFGVLSGKHAGAAPDSGRGDWVKARLADPRTQRIVSALTEVAHGAHCPPAQAALAWLRTRPGLVLPIVGVRKPAHLEDALASLDVVLTAEQIGKLDAASAIPPSFPGRMWADEKLVDAHITGGTHWNLAEWKRPC